MSYITISELGQGGFGIVEEVRDPTGKRFARKTLNVSNAQFHVGISEDQLKKRFAREVRHQSAINHPNIVEILDHDLSADPPFYIMRLASGTLRKEINADRTLGGNPHKALFDILAGLEAMHSLGFTHRDLKPENVLTFTNQSGEKRYAISDFGLITGSNSQTSTLTATGAGGGTPYYAAPECVNNFHRATNRSDIYSFGAILHDIFGGGQSRIPYSRLSVPDPNIAPIVEKCTEANGHRRYRDIAELRDDLYRALDTQTISFTSQEEEIIISLLQGSDELDDDEWDRICVCLENNDADGVSNRNIFRELKIAHLENLLGSSVSVFHAVGNLFCNYVLDNEGSFNFDYCDVLANKLKFFLEHGDIGLQSKALIALMTMGATHNRWYVEGLFWEKATNPDTPNELITRFLIDIEVLGLTLSRYINHIVRSIDVSLDQLPESIRAATESEA